MLAAILAVVALVSGLAAGTVVFFESRGTAGLHAELGNRTGSDLAYRAVITRAEDAQQQDADVRSAVARTFAPTGVSFAVTRALEADAYFRFTTEAGVELAGPATAITLPDAAAGATPDADFTTGRAPQTADEVAVHEGTAAALGLAVGDECLINETAFTVSGTWRIADPLDPRWFGDPMVTAGGGEDRRGPFVITEDAWTRMGDTPKATWTMVPTSITEITGANFALVTQAWDGVRAQWRGEIAGLASLELQSRLSRTLDEFGQRITGLRAIEPVAFAIMASAALVALAQLVQLLVATRARESALFWARGQSVLGIARRMTAEVGISAVAGAVLGLGVAAAATAAVGDPGILGSVWAGALIVPAIVVVGATALAAIIAFRSALGISTPSRGGRAVGRATTVAVPGIAVLAALLAALSVWQLRLYGSPLTPTADGGRSVDPIAIAAPAAALLAVVLIGRAAFPAVVGILDRRSRVDGIRTHLSFRTLVRESRRLVAPLVVVALAVGSTVVAASFSATWSTSFDRTAQLHAGADLRASSRFIPITEAQFDAVAATEGVTAVAPLDSQVLTIGTITGTLLSATPDAVRDLMTSAGGLVPPAEVADAIELVVPGPVVPDGADELTLRVEALGFDGPPTIAAWIADRLGRLHRITFDAPVAGPDGVLRYTAAAVGSAGTIVSFDLDLDPLRDAATPATFRLLDLASTGAGAGEAVGLDEFWVPDTLTRQRFAPEPLPDGTGVVVTSGVPFLRLTASLDNAATDGVRPGVVISQRLATELDLVVGDIISFPLRNDLPRLNSYVTAIVPAIPGARADRAILLNLALTLHLQLRTVRDPGQTTDLWVATSAETAVRDRIRPLLAPNTRIDAGPDPVGREVLGAAAIALWGVAIGSALIAFVAAAAAARARTRWGRSDIAALRALGVGSRDQSAIVVGEMGVVMVIAAVTGLAAGALTAVLTVPELARAAVDRAAISGVTDLAVAWGALAVALAALAVGVAVIITRLGRRTARLASTLLPDGDHE